MLIGLLSAYGCGKPICRMTAAFIFITYTSSVFTSRGAEAQRTRGEKRNSDTSVGRLHGGDQKVATGRIATLEAPYPLSFSLRAFLCASVPLR
jgi:hypothetical protein